MRIDGCSKLAYLFPVNLAQTLVHLQVLQIRECDSLKCVINEEADNIEGADYLLCWPKLKALQIWNCKILNYVFPVTLGQGLLNLEFVEIFDCPQLKQLFEMKNEKDGRRKRDILLQGLQVIRLVNLENLSRLCPENFVMSLQSLKEFKVQNCPQFTDQQVVSTLQADLKVRLLYYRLVFLTKFNI